MNKHQTTTKDVEQIIKDASDIVIELDGDIETVVTATLSKNRFGPTARFDMVFDPATGIFTEVDREEAEKAAEL